MEATSFERRELENESGKCRERKKKSKDNSATKESFFKTPTSVIVPHVATAKRTSHACAGLLEQNRGNEEERQGKLRPRNKRDEKQHVPRV